MEACSSIQLQLVGLETAISSKDAIITSRITSVMALRTNSSKTTTICRIMGRDVCVRKTWTVSSIRWSSGITFPMSTIQALLASVDLARSSHSIQANDRRGLVSIKVEHLVGSNTSVTATILVVKWHSSNLEADQEAMVCSISSSRGSTPSITAVSPGKLSSSMFVFENSYSRQ